MFQNAMRMGTVGVSLCLAAGQALGQGDWPGFWVPETIDVPDEVHSYIAGDLDEDGVADLAAYTGDVFSTQLSVFLGQSDQTFVLDGSYDLGERAGDRTFADLNKDGHLDFVCVNRPFSPPSGADHVSVLLGNGDGSFSTKQTYAAGDGVHKLVVHDLDDDGDLDIATANQGMYDPENDTHYGESLSVFLGDGTGDFSPAVQHSMDEGVSFLAAGNINGDAIPDLVGDCYVFYGIGGGQFTRSQLGAETPLCARALGDFNGDGLDDIAGSEAIWLNGPGEEFERAGEITIPASSPLDIDGDGDLDLYEDGGSVLVVYYGDGKGALEPAALHPKGTIVDPLLRRGSGRIKAPEYIPVTERIGLFVLEDLNDDGLDDLIQRTGYGDLATLLRNNKGKYDEVWRSDNEDDRWIWSIDTGDLNEDGRTDVVTGMRDGYREIWIYTGEGNGAFSEPSALEALTLPYEVVLEDFNGDDHLDIAAAYSGSALVSVFAGNGDGTFAEGLHFDVNGGPLDLAIGQFDNDGSPDFATISGSMISVKLSYGNGTFKPFETYSTGAPVVSLLSGDFNGDGFDDLAALGNDSDAVYILRNNGDGTFSSAVKYDVARRPQGFAVGDVDGDGEADLITASQQEEKLCVLLGEGDGTFQQSQEYAIGITNTHLVTSDWDRDSDLDVLVANSAGLLLVVENLKVDKATVAGWMMY